MASSQDMLPPPVTHPSLKFKDIIQHPNGSDGWLPAENLNPIQHHTERPFQRPSISAPPSKRKSAFRGPSTSRHAPVAVAPSTEARENVNDAPAVSSDEDLQNRVVSVNNNLTLKQRSKIAKLEAKDGKRISKIIKEGGRTEKQALDILIKELEELQKFQKNAFKSEARAQANHTKALFDFKKIEAVYLNAKMNYETTLAELNAESGTLETLKTNSKEATEQVQEKTAQVESLRTTLAIEGRERELKLSDLKGSTVNPATMKRSSSLWR